MSFPISKVARTTLLASPALVRISSRRPSQSSLQALPATASIPDAAMMSSLTM